MNFSVILFCFGYSSNLDHKNSMIYGQKLKRNTLNKGGDSKHMIYDQFTSENMLNFLPLLHRILRTRLIGNYLPIYIYIYVYKRTYNLLMHLTATAKKKVF